MRVTWSIDIDGTDDPREAAAQALAIMQDPGSTAVVFDVDGTTVDLEEVERCPECGGMPWDCTCEPPAEVTARLEEIRAEIVAERVSWGELAELQALARFIGDDDPLLLEWAGVPEGSRRS